MFGLKILKKAKGIAIAMAMAEMFVSVVSFRMALIDIARARVMTRKNQRRIIIFHLYFIRMNMAAKARAKEKMIERKVGVGWSSGVWSPKGSSSPSVLITKSPMNCVARNIERRIIVIEILCFMVSRRCFSF